MTSKTFALLSLGLSILLLPWADLSAKEATLSDLKPGRHFEVLEDISVPIPPVLRLLGEIPTLQVTDSSVRLATPPGTTEPVCLLSGLVLNPELPSDFKLPKGTKIEVNSVEKLKKSDPLYAGPAVAFSIQAPGTPLKAKLRCFPGKGAKTAMPIEVLEKIFRRKIRLLSE